ncbi:MAG TPA: AAA family ATPase, partial [Candidatus Tumulicola sp.]|nr:AAA family ATPase [Candidatus Tumulicola sp.]
FERAAADPAARRGAADLYAELLPECADEWLIGPRERLREAYLSALWQIARDLRGRRDPLTAQRYLERMLAEDPWREDALRSLMAVRCEAGDRSSALALCARFEGRLAAEMHVALMPETLALRRAIERNDPLPTVPTDTRAGDPRPLSELPFRGRDAEMSQLLAAWESTRAGRGATALVFGEPGIGKTRLAAEFALRVEANGGRVLWGITETPEQRPYQAMSDVVRAALSYVDANRLADFDRRSLAALVPSLTLANDSPETGDANGRQRMARSVAKLLAHIAAERPLLVVLEDAHEAGSASTGLREEVVAACARAPVMFLVTAREGDERWNQALRRLRRPSGHRAPGSCPLGRIAAGAVFEIAAEALGARVKPVQVRKLAERSAGHPLFLSALLYGADGSGGDGEMPLPNQLRDAIDGRLARLSPDAHLLLQAASIAGRTFDLETVAGIVGWNEAEFSAAADELVARRIVRESPRTAFDYEFAHEFIADAAYESLAAAERARWHRRTARVLLERYASRTNELAPSVARHFDLAGAAREAAEQYLIAARAAYAGFANDEALAYARRGLALEASLPSLRFDLFAVQDDVLDRIAERAEQRAISSEMYRLAAACGDPNRLREALRRRESVHRYFAEYAAALAVLEELKALSTGDAFWEAVALRDQAQAYGASGAWSKAYETIAAAVPRAAAAADAMLLVSVLVQYVYLATRLGRRDEAEDAIEQVRLAAQRSTSPMLLMRAAYCETVARTNFQDWERARPAATQLLRLAGRIGSRGEAAAAHNT